MKILALETSTEACSAALYCDGSLFQRFEVAPRKHGDLLLPMIDAVLAEAEVSLAQCDYLAYGRGPGAFTGIRVGAAAVQALAFAEDLLVAPVSTLAAVAYAAASKHGVQGIVMIAMDARMGEIYSGIFDVSDSDARPLMEERVCAPEALTLADSPDERAPVLVCGTGLQAYPMLRQAFTGTSNILIDAEALPDAAAIAKLALNITPIAAEDAQPVYIRNNVVQNR